MPKRSSFVESWFAGRFVRKRHTPSREQASTGPIPWTNTLSDRLRLCGIVPHIARTARSIARHDLTMCIHASLWSPWPESGCVWWVGAGPLMFRVREPGDPARCGQNRAAGRPPRGKCGERVWLGPSPCRKAIAPRLHRRRGGRGGRRFRFTTWPRAGALDGKPSRVGRPAVRNQPTKCAEPHAGYPAESLYIGVFAS